MVESESETSDGYFGCACGKIRVDVVEQRSSTFVPPTAALCQCHDCFDFANNVAEFRKKNLPESTEKADALTEANATDMRQIFKSDAVKMSGEEFLQGVKLREDSPCIRYYSTCCGTPIMANYTAAPFFLVYQHTIAASVSPSSGNANESSKEAESKPRFQRIPPTVVLNHKSAPSGSAPTPDGIPVSDSLSFGFIGHALARAIFGLVALKKSSVITPQLDKIPVQIGVDSIGKAKEVKDAN